MKTALRRILSESARLDVSPDTLADDADLYAAGLSSLATVHLMLAIEDEFGIEIPDDAAEKIVTVGNAVKYISTVREINTDLAKLYKW